MRSTWPIDAALTHLGLFHSPQQQGNEPVRASAAPIRGHVCFAVLEDLFELVDDYQQALLGDNGFTTSTKP